MNSLNEWRRLTTLWQTYLTIDDWDLVLSSFVVSDPPKFELSYQDARSRRRRDLAASSSDRHLWRQIQTGWLTGDGQLSGAASVWSWVCAALANDMRDTQPKVGRLIASAFFRLSPAHPGRATVTEALEELAAGKHEILKLIVGGPLRWPDAMLTEVADHLISANMAVDEVPILLQLIGELERRGSVTLASKMLRLMPTVIPQRISPADIAEIVSLSRRHEVPELISRNAAADWLAGPVSECLSVEDIVWIFQTSSIPSEDIERVRRQLQSNARLKRTAHWAGRILGEMLSIRLSAEEHRRPRGSFSEQLT